jgi:hypothetical protein
MSATMAMKAIVSAGDISHTAAFYASRLQRPRPSPLASTVSALSV